MSSQLGFPGFWERPTVVFFVFVPARDKLAADLLLNVSY